MNAKRSVLWALLPLLGAAAALHQGTARAQGAPYQVSTAPSSAWEPQIAAERDAVQDPPGRAGRLAEVSGSAWLFHPEAGEWLQADRNRPLTTGDRLSTDQNGRVDVRIGSTAFRLDSGTELEVVRLDDDRIELHLLSGSIAVRLRTPQAARELALTTDDGRFSASTAGRFRVDRRDGVSQFTLAAGQGLYEGPGSALTVSAGQRAEFWIDGSGRAQYSLGEPRYDGFAAWAVELDRNDDRGPASRYLSAEMTGAEDLDRHGRWDQDPEYGAVWVPNGVAADWAPYTTGRWTWVSPWGWTWVDNAPWGFAPFHYGRWVYARERWCWTPGRYVARPVYAPALVGWVGGSNVSVSVNIGGGPAVGWFPLAPREAYLPYGRVSPRYVRTVNGPHYRDGGELERLIQSPGPVLRGVEYRNRKFHHGTTTMPVAAFSQRGGLAPVVPGWRGQPAARDFDRLPASPVGLAPPPWAGQRLEPGRAPGRAPGRGVDAGRGFGGVDRGFDRGNDRGNDRGPDRPFDRPGDRDFRDNRDNRDARGERAPRPPVAGGQPVYGAPAPAFPPPGPTDTPLIPPPTLGQGRPAMEPPGADGRQGRFPREDRPFERRVGPDGRDGRERGFERGQERGPERGFDRGQERAPDRGVDRGFDRDRAFQTPRPPMVPQPPGEAPRPPVSVQPTAPQTAAPPVRPAPAPAVMASPTPPPMVPPPVRPAEAVRPPPAVVQPPPATQRPDPRGNRESRESNGESGWERRRQP